MTGALRSAHVIVASTSAAAGTAADTTGPAIAAWLQERGFSVAGPTVVSDGIDVEHAVRSALDDAPAVIVTTGGTGVSPSDRTPEAVAPLLELQLPGIIEELRRRGAEHLPAAVLTRGVAGFAGPTFVVTLPGSAGGVRDGLAVLEPILDHLLAQRTGAKRSNFGHAGRR